MLIENKIGYMPLLLVDGGHSEEIHVSSSRLQSDEDTEYFKEYQFNRKITNLLIKRAKEIGFAAVNLVPEDYPIPIGTRINRANITYIKYNNKEKVSIKNKKALLVGIHYAPREYDWGQTEEVAAIYYSKNDTDGEKTAQRIHHELKLSLEELKTNVKPGSFRLINETNISTVLIEAGFRIQKKTAEWMSDEDFQELIAESMLSGITKIYGIKEMRSLLPNLHPDTAEDIESIKSRVQILEKKLSEIEKNREDKKIDNLLD